MVGSIDQEEWMRNLRYRALLDVQFRHGNEFSSNCSLPPRHSNPVSVILIDIHNLVPFVDSHEVRNSVDAH